MSAKKFMLCPIPTTSLRYAEDPKKRDTSTFGLGYDHDMMVKRRDNAELFLEYSIKTYAAILFPLLEQRNASVFRRVQTWLNSVSTIVRDEVTALCEASAKGAVVGASINLLLSMGRSVVAGGPPSATAPIHGAIAGAQIGILYHLKDFPERLRQAIERSKRESRLMSLISAIEHSLDSLENIILRASVQTLLQYQLSIMNFKISSVQRFAVLKARLGLEYCSHGDGYFPKNMCQDDSVQHLTSVLPNSTIIRNEGYGGSFFSQKFKYDRELREYYTNLMKYDRNSNAYFFYGYLAWTRTVTFEELHYFSNAVYFGVVVTLYYQHKLLEKRHKSYCSPPILLRSPACKGEERLLVSEVLVRL